MTENPYRTPSAELATGPAGYHYVGFWWRVLASLIDTVLLLLVSAPVLHALYGPTYWTSQHFISGPGDFLVSYVFPAVAVVLFWVYRSATPGKMIIGARIVDARTGEPPGVGQAIGRYLAYYVSTIPLLLGFVWVAFDARKQGWHDKLAKTLVVRSR